MTDSAHDKNTVSTRNELVAYLESGCKPESNWKLGTEHEKFGYTLDDLRPLPYEGERGIRAILTGLAEEFDWQPVMEDGLPIALLDDTGASITLEPGGQLELSGALLDNIHQTCTEVNTHLK
ncbi:glutamate-cysteine ligase family protein, partial [Pseudomonadota bacterium]